MSAFCGRASAARVKFSLLFIALCFSAAIPAPAQQTGTDITGHIQDVNSGFPVPNATVELHQGSKTVAQTKSAPDGTFSFKNEPQGIYNIVILAGGYQSARSGDIVATSGQQAIQYQFALQRISAATTAMRTIASVNVGGRAALQTSTTINKSVDPAVLQSQNYMRAGDVLATVPGLNAYTSSAVGDDLNIGIRGFNDSETATLLDGHPIGPIGAVGGTFGGGQGAFDYQDSPFWGLRNVQTIFGSGAAGIYGATTIAGAVDFQTIEPTKDPHGLFEFGIGNNGKSMTAAQATGSFNKFGYALAWGVEGTYGMFIPQTVPQTGLLGNNQTAANLAANTYEVTGNYTLRDGLVKFGYQFDPTTNVTFTGYSGYSWDDKSGNGDTDFNSYDFVLYTTQQALLGGPLPPITLANGNSFSCGANLVPVQADTTSGGACLTPQQYAGGASGPAGGGPGPWQAIRNQDYHGHFTKSFGRHLVTLDGFIDNYGIDYNRNIAGGFSSTCNCFTGFFRTNIFNTNGVLAGDDFLTGKHDISFGFYTQHQSHRASNFGQTGTDAAGNPTFGITDLPTFYLNSNLYYVRDQYQPSEQLSLFGSFWFNHTNVTNATSFDPRLTVMWRPDPADVIRFTGGKANSVPDPSLAFSPVLFNTNFNGLTLCPGGLINVASGGNPTLQPETASDVEGSVGHRFANGTLVQLEAYTAWENNALLSGTVPFATLGVTPPPGYLDQLFARVKQVCPNVPNPTLANLTASAAVNAANARYQGIVFSTNVNILRNLSFSGDYNIQSAVFLNIPDSILMNNPFFVNGTQVQGTPLRKADMGFAYSNPRGAGVTFDGHFIDTNNGWNRPAFWFANASFSNNFGPVTLNFGVNNIFNSVAQQYGYIGLGTYTPVNSFNASSFPNALAEGSEEFGLPYRQMWFTITRRF